MPQISRKDFADKMRERIPELAKFSDAQIYDKLVEMRPDLKEVIRTPDQAAAEEQGKLEKRSKSIVDPETWKNYPFLGSIAKSILGVLPATGAIVGGAASTPETLGLGTIAGGALGAGAGRGLQDISSQMLGLENSSPMDKAKNIAMDTGLTAIMPGAMTAVKHPVDTSRLAAGAISGAEKALVPKGIQPFIKMPFLEKWAAGSGVKTPISDPMSSRVAELMEEGLGKQSVRVKAPSSLSSSELNLPSKMDPILDVYRPPQATPELSMPLNTGPNNARIAQLIEEGLGNSPQSVGRPLPSATPQLGLPSNINPQLLDLLEQEFRGKPPVDLGSSLKLGPGKDIWMGKNY